MGNLFENDRDQDAHLFDFNHCRCQTFSISFVTANICAENNVIKVHPGTTKRAAFLSSHNMPP